jgi:hypothetical protein
MHLHQRRFLVYANDFVITETCVQVSSRTPTKANSYEVPFAVINLVPSLHRSTPILWAVLAAVFGGFSIFALWSLFFDPSVPRTSEMIKIVLIFLSAGLGCAYNYHRKKIDSVVFRNVNSGMPVLILDRKVPTLRHVDEFREIIVERIRALKNFR